MCEVQFHCESIMKVKDKGHKCYEWVRLLLENDNKLKPGQ